MSVLGALKSETKSKSIFIISTLAASFILFFCYCYGDVLITTLHGVNFWDCLFSGNIRNFYEYNTDAHLVSGVYNDKYSAYYDFLIYVIFAIWDFPLWAVKKVFGITNILDSVGAVLWAKSIILPFLVLTVVLLYKIASFYQQDSRQKYISIYLFLTSVFTTAYLVLLGQYDIIVISIMLLGIYWLMLEKRVLFIVAFSLAVPIKAFSLLLFVVLLLYKEKNVFKILLHLIAVMIPIVVMRLLIPISASNVSIFSSFLFVNQIPLSYGNVSVAVICIMMLLIFCYLKKPSTDKKQQCIEIVYLSFLSFSVLLATIIALPYWFMYMVPFAFLVISVNSKFNTINILLEIFMSFFVVLSQMFRYYWCFASSISNNSLLALLPHNAQTTFIAEDFFKKIIGATAYEQYSSFIEPVCIAIFVAALIVFAIINSPWRKFEIDAPSDANTGKFLYVARVALGFFICLIPAVGFLFF